MDLRRGTTYAALLFLFSAQRSVSSKGLLNPVKSILVKTHMLTPKGWEREFEGGRLKTNIIEAKGREMVLKTF